jgi:glycosyltransferase involved in cell wall biosynthesis
VRKLENLDGVEVHGNVEEMAPFFAHATLAIAPMRSGSGVPMKILEAWASGLPVIATPWSAGGVETGGAEALLVADGADQWVRGVGRVLDDRQYSDSLANAGRVVFERVYREDRIRRASVEAAEAVLQSNWG